MDVTGKSLFGRSYGVAYADPDWLFDLHSEKGAEKSPQAQYDCSSTEEIGRFLKDLLEFCMAPNSVLVMWCTWPMLARGDCHAVMRMAGFEPKTGGSWVKMTSGGKVAFGSGYIYRGADEPWLIGTRGEPVSLVKNQRNVLLDDEILLDYQGLLDGASLLEERREHSRKPEAMWMAIERQFRGPRLEIFARTDREGWDVWGDEVGKFPMGEQQLR